MTAEQIVGLLVALLVMLTGCVGCVIPGIPGTPLVLVAAIVHRLVFGAASVSNWTIGVLVAITLISVGLDYLASVWGARKLGASWRGLVGAVLGVLVGMFFGLPGLILGPFIGAMLFEIAGGYEWRRAGKAGLGASIGLLAGALGKFVLCVMMTALFAASVIHRSV